MSRWLFDSGPEFSLQNALSLARASRLAYESESDVLQELQQQQMQGKFFDSMTHSQAFIAHDAEKVVVSFRGTEHDQLADWMTDFSTEKIQSQVPPDEHLGVWFDTHSGFYFALKSLWLALEQTLNQPDLVGKPLYLTGHSLGGALATLAALRWQDEKREVRNVYTFGSPRAGGVTFFKEYRARLRNRTFRFVNNNDVVTRIPFFLFGYMHIGELDFLDAHGKLHRNYSKVRVVQNFFQELVGQFMKGLKGSFGDHSLERYLEHLEKLV